MKPRIVLSGVNFVEAGPLAIFQDALEILSAHFAAEYEIVALVHRQELFSVANVCFLEFPEVKASWLKRLHFEYVACKRISHKLDPVLWLAMHDMTPNVKAKVRVVYCHNPAPFYRIRWRDIRLDPRFGAFRALYLWLYRVHIAQNDFVVVQQEWMRREFRRRYPVRQVIVAHPSPPVVSQRRQGAIDKPRERIVFFYPAFPRCFKNVETLLQAVSDLHVQGVKGFELWLTVKGDENRYANSLKQEFGHLEGVRWLGPLARERVEELYDEADCLVFPSCLETWGMPLLEFKRTGKQILAADLPYAHETIGAYDRAQFFAPRSAIELARAMLSFLQGELHTAPTAAVRIDEPYANGWKSLFGYLLGNHKGAR